MSTHDSDRQAIAKEADRRLLHAALARLGTSSSPLLRSLAGDVRSGRLTLSDLASKQELAAPFGAAITRYQKWQQGLTAQERETLQGEVIQRIMNMRDQIARQRKAGGGGDEE